MSMLREALYMENGQRAPRNEVRREGHEWEQARKVYHHERLERAVAAFTAGADYGEGADQGPTIWAT